MELTVARNATLTLRCAARSGLLRRARTRAAAEDWAQRLQVKAGALDDTPLRHCPAATSRRSCWPSGSPPSPSCSSSTSRPAASTSAPRPRCTGCSPSWPGRGHRHPDDLLGAARGARDGRPRPGHARGPHHRRPQPRRGHPRERHERRNPLLGAPPTPPPPRPHKKGPLPRPFGGSPASRKPPVAFAFFALGFSPTQKISGSSGPGGLRTCCSTRRSSSSSRSGRHW